MKKFNLTVSGAPLDLEEVDVLRPQEIADMEQPIELTGTFTMEEITALVYLLNSWIKK